MLKSRPCGCKGLRSCLVCEQEYGAWKIPNENLSDENKEKAYVYCPHCQLAWPGWNANSWTSHPNHEGKSIRFPGVKIVLNFISELEEEELVKQIDQVPWEPSQSGRLKQNYGPKCNFKKQRVRIDNFEGYPVFTKFIQDRFRTVDILQNFYTVEQCSLEYTKERGASIDPHIDDCWIWGERIPTLSLLSDSVLTLNKYTGPNTRYNLQMTSTYPSIINTDGLLKANSVIKAEYESMEKCKQPHVTDGKILNNLNVSNDEDEPKLIRLPMPRRSLLIFYGHPRYEWEHGILRDDVTSRRVCITYRELTPIYLAYGPKAEIGQQILAAGETFWDHKEKYMLKI